MPEQPVGVLIMGMWSGRLKCELSKSYRKYSIIFRMDYVFKCISMQNSLAAHDVPGSKAMSPIRYCQTIYIFYFLFVSNQ